MSNSHFVERTQCPACRSQARRELYAAAYTEPPISAYLSRFYDPQGGVEFEYLEGARFVLDECGACGLVYQRFVPDDFLTSRLYDVWIDPVKVHTAQTASNDFGYYQQLAREIKNIIRHFRHVGEHPARLRLFDFGMGWGDWCRMAQSFGCAVYGAELSPSRIEFAQTLGIPIVAWDDIPGQRFDFINTEQVLEHVPNPLEIVQHLAQALKPGGLLRISVPDGWDIRRRLAVLDWTAPKNTRNSLNAVAPLEHPNCFSHRSLIELARCVDLQEVSLRPLRSLDAVLDITLRDGLRPFHHALIRLRTGERVGATRLVFQRRA